MTRASATRNRRLLMAVGVALLVISLPFMLATGGEEGEEFGEEEERFEESGEEEPWERGGEGFPLTLLLNRATAETGFLVLTLAALGGVLRRPGSPVRGIASSTHYYVALAALALVLIHSATGLPEALEQLAGMEISLGMLIGIGATAVLIVAAAGHLVPRWLGRDWPAKAVHASVYSAFAATAVHSAAVGHEAGTYVGGVALVLLALLLTRLNRRRSAYQG